MLIDTHAHLYWEDFEKDFDQVLQRSKEADVTTIINVGVDVEKSKLALNQAEEIKDITLYSTIGIHPHEAFKYLNDPAVSIQQDINKLEDIYKSNPQKVIGVGECGLDYFFESNPDFIPSSISIDQLKDLQIKLFQAQIDLAKKLDLPLIVHIRDDRGKNPQNIECWDEVLEMVRGWRGILHCYSGLEETTKRVLSSEFDDFLISFAANITYPKNDYLREAAKFLPLEKICLETDSPFLSPQSNRGQRNEPSSVLEIAQLIGQIKGISVVEVGYQTTQNVKELLRI